MNNAFQERPGIVGIYRGVTAKRFVFDDDAMVIEQKGGAGDGRLVCVYSKCVRDRTFASCSHVSAVSAYLARQSMHGSRGRRDD